MQLAKTAAAASNPDEAYRYYTKILEVESANYEAWFGKAEAAGWNSNLRSGRFPELLSGIQRAIQVAPVNIQQGLRERGASVIGAVSAAYFRLSHQHFLEYVALNDSWGEHVSRSAEALAALAGANDMDPRNRTVLEIGILISQSLLQGTEYADPYDTDSEGNPELKSWLLMEPARAHVQRYFDTFVLKLKAMDPTYKSPEIKIAGGSGCGTVAAILVVLVVLGGGALWIAKAIFL